MARFLAWTGRFCAVLVLCGVASPVLCQSTGPNSPDLASGWDVSENVTDSDNDRALAVHALSSPSSILVVTGFDFSIPSDHKIDGIEVEIERSRATGFLSGNVEDQIIQLTKDDGTTLIGENKAKDNNWPTSDAYESYGGSTDLWDETWTPTDINNSSFGVVISTVQTSGLWAISQIDHIRITVYHHFDVLPITLSAFDAILTHSGSVKLTWSTASELNNDGFTVERSADGERYEALSEIPGSGTTNTARHYTYEDRMPLAGRSYYRLMQTDYDGSFTYSPVVAVDNGLDPTSVLTVYPNPSDGTFIGIRLRGLTGAAEIPVAIYDATGRIIATHTLIGNGEATLEEQWYPDSPLSPGIYIVRAGPGLNLMRKLVVP